MGAPLIKPAPITAPASKVPVDASSIGNAFGEDRGHCKTHPDDAQCKLLAGGQRTNLSMLIAYRLALAAKSYGDAVNQIRVDEQLKKPEELPTLTDLVIDAVAAFGGKAVTTAIKSLRTKPTTALVDLGVGVLDIELEDDVKSADEGVVAYVITGATTAAKKGAKRAAGAETKTEFERDQTMAKDYLTHLEEVGGVAFDELFGPTIANLNDADLILYYHSWDPKVHSTPAYKGAIEQRLATYRASPASKVGRTFARVHEKKPGADGNAPGIDEVVRYEGNDDLRDTKLVMHYFTDGSSPALYYYTRDYSGGIANAPGGDQFMKPGSDISSLAKDGWQWAGEVESEFRDAAIASNERAWGVKYEVQITEAHDPMKRAAAAGAAKRAADTKPIKVPKELTMQKQSLPRNTAPDALQEPAPFSPVMSID